MNSMTYVCRHQGTDSSNLTLPPPRGNPPANAMTITAPLATSSTANVQEPTRLKRNNNPGFAFTSAVSSHDHPCRFFSLEMALLCFHAQRKENYYCCLVTYYSSLAGGCLLHACILLSCLNTYGKYQIVGLVTANCPVDREASSWLDSLYLNI